MPKAYWIAHVALDTPDATQSDAYKNYIAGAGPAFEAHGAKFLARGGEFELAEGQNLGSRHVVIEFPSLQAAQACYHSDEYAEAKKHRQAVSNGTIFLVEGVDG